MFDENTIRLLVLLLLFVCSAFFSGSETALMAIDRMRVKYLVHKKRRGADKLEAVLEKPDRLLGAILVGNNLVNVAASVVATGLFLEYFGDQGEWLTIALLTPLLLVFAEVLPKTYAAQSAEQFSFKVLPPIRVIMWLLRPVTWVLSLLAKLLTSALKGEEERPFISEDEIRAIITAGEEAGTVHRDKRRMLHGVLGLSQIQARDVMVPRMEVVGIDADLSFAEVLTHVQQARHSRFPVYEGDLDNVIGVIHSKAILSYVHRPEAFDIRSACREPFFVPESQQVETLMQAFRVKREHLAVVVDEYGGVEGIATLEDVVEEIVGEIQDEYDVEAVMIREIGPRRYLLDGSIGLKDVNRRFHLELPDEHANTLAGLLLSVLGTIPESGQTCIFDGITLTARRVVGKRVETIEMLLPADEAE
ncbi:MAG: DUF21 domain-containing protein [Desulfuromonadales bacterium]|nr:DUF21 domain-containing protein [Desulfuromonadales bacterium]NIS41217.1 DUF21 domain-containing protein [Desulfuromonadales bacterium]